ncbi:MAG: tetratricopeptide repeat protein [Ignavibacteria bacterium]|nr:tetratricopeptide repeat protein [Ignavibacteria bacterium]
MIKHILIFLLIIVPYCESYSQSTKQDIYQKALEQYYSSNFNDAIKFFNDYLVMDTQNWDVINYIGLSYLGLKNYPKAKENFSSVIALNKYYTKGYVNRANVYALEGNYSAAERDYRDAIKYERGNLDIYYGLSLLYINSREYNKALVELNTVTSLDPKNSRAFMNKAIVNMLIDDTAKIFENVSESLYWDSNYIFKDLDKSLIFTVSERFKYALSVFNDAVSQNPNSYLINFNRGIIYYMIGNFTDAIKDFEKAKKLYKGDDEKIHSLIDKIIRISKFNG